MKRYTHEIRAEVVKRRKKNPSITDKELFAWLRSKGYNYDDADFIVATGRITTALT